MFCKHDRKTRNIIAKPALLGKGIKERKIAEGKCVKAIVLTCPMRFAMDEATRLEIPEIIFVVKKRVPRSPSVIANLRVKKYATHDGGITPEANESKAKRRQILTNTVREAGDKTGQIDFFGNGVVGALPSLPLAASPSSSSDIRPWASNELSSFGTFFSGCSNTSSSHRSLRSTLKPNLPRPRKA